MAGARRQVQSAYGRRTRQPSGSSLPAFFFWTFFLVTTAIAYLWTYNQTDVVAARMAETRLTIVQLENENRELQAAIDNLARMDRITRLARNQLEMHVPAPESLIVYLPEMPE
ncbi:MAG: cell division protein FtsL [Candidatus Neomarinimicrobiota bacterium]